MKIFLTHLEESLTKGMKNINGEPNLSFKSATDRFYIYKNRICSIPLICKHNFHPFNSYDLKIVSKEWYKCRYYITVNYDNFMEHFRGKTFIDSVLLYWKYYLKCAIYKELKYWLTTILNIFKIFK